MGRSRRGCSSFNATGSGRSRHLAMENLPPVRAPAQSVPPAAATTAERAPSESAGFHRVLAGLSNQLDDGQRLSGAALRAHGALSPSQLLALQAGIYRYSEAVELATKLVDKASNAVRTTLQSQ
jgi:hypothetical protein